MIDVIVIGAIALAAIAGVITFAIRASTADHRAEAASVASTAAAGKLEIATATIATQTNRADDEKRRADALDDALAATWTDADPATARERVLARWQLSRVGAAANATAGSTASAVPAPSHAGTGSQAAGAGDGLLKPGE
jgi:hypothetical protein